MKISERHPSMSNLFEYDEFCNLSYETIQLFIITFSLDNLNQSIRDQICKRLIQKVSNTATTHKYVSNHSSQSANIRTFSAKGNKYFDGIMRYLAKRTAGNIHTNGTIHIATNYPPNYKVNPQNMVDFDSFKSYFVQTSLNTILFDFKNWRVQLSHYSLQSSNNFFMMNWILETSNDLRYWKVIDKRMNCTDLVTPRS